MLRGRKGVLGVVLENPGPAVVGGLVDWLDVKVRGTM